MGSPHESAHPSEHRWKLLQPADQRPIIVKAVIIVHDIRYHPCSHLRRLFLVTKGFEHRRYGLSAERAKYLLFTPLINCKNAFATERVPTRR